VDTCYMFRQYFAPKGSDKICMMTTRLACNRAIESSYWRMDDNSDVGLLMGCVLYRLPIELEFMDFGYLFPLIWNALFFMHKLIEQDTAVLHQAITVKYNFVSVFHDTLSGLCGFTPCTCSL
jgi:hypothetical protein